MKKAKYQFYLNTADFYKWTRCLECDGQTKVRKFCLMINYQEKEKFRQMISLNKSCKYCPTCDLIIAQQAELDDLLQQMIPPSISKVTSDKYAVFGTMDRKDWKANQQNPVRNALSLVSFFKDILYFDIQPAGWYKA